MGRKTEKLMLRDDRRESKMRSLVLQKDYLAILQDRHMLWIDGTENSEVSSLHLECLALIHQLQEKYQFILDLYENPPSKAL